jgi:Tfp pilus assembly protein PilF
VDLGPLDQGEELLHRCLQLTPVTHAFMDLALGYQRAGDLLRAKEYGMRALYYLRHSFWIDPQDPQAVCGLAFAYMEVLRISIRTPFVEVAG